MFPASVEWLAEGAKARDATPVETMSVFLNHADTARNVPVAAHWRELLTGLSIDGYGGPAPQWRQVLDERMVTSCYVRVAPGQVRRISRGDWVRLCFVDAPGGDPLPYGTAFLEDFEQKHCYDRFWNPQGRDGNVTRFLFSGYSSVVCGENGVHESEDPFFENHIREHFRRHYARIALIVLFQKASLLALSGWISNAVTAYSREEVGRAGAEQPYQRQLLDEARFERTMQDLREQFLRFTHMYWFTGVSNHIQATELYDLWRQHQGLDRLYREVDSEAEDAYAFVTAKQQARSVRSAERQAQSGMLLGALAAIAVPLSLGLSFLGINVAVADDRNWGSVGAWGVILLAVGLPTMITGCGLLLHSGRRRLSRNDSLGRGLRRVWTALGGAGIASSYLGLILVLVSGG